MSKPMLVTLPLKLLVMDCWPLKIISERGVRSAESKDVEANNFPQNYFCAGAGGEDSIFHAERGSKHPRGFGPEKIAGNWGAAASFADRKCGDFLRSVHR